MEEPKGRKLSVVALSLTLAIVAAAIALGVLGPQLTPRAAGTTLASLGDLSAIATSLAATMEADAAAREPDSPLPSRDAIDKLWRSLVGVGLPDLESQGYRLVSAAELQHPARLPGIALLYEGTDETPAESIFVSATPQGEGWGMYDRFGQVTPMLPGDFVFESAEAGSTVDRPTLVWSDGKCVYLCRCDEAAALDSLREALGAP